MGEVKFVPIHNWDNCIACAIKGRLNDQGGETTLKNGTSKFEISYADDQTGIVFVSGKTAPVLLTWDVFFATIDIMKQNGGKALKGDASKKLGSKDLKLDTIEGYVASTIFGKKKNQTVEKNIVRIGAILKWADIVKVGKDYLELNEEYK